MCIHIDKNIYISMYTKSEYMKQSVAQKGPYNHSECHVGPTTPYIRGDRLRGTTRAEDAYSTYPTSYITKYTSIRR